MKKRTDLEESCALCEHGEEIFGGDYFICKKKGVMEPGKSCKAFCFDPLKIKVSVPKIPKFTPINNVLNSVDETEKEEAK